MGPGAMHVERYGHGGTPIVLVHGFGTSSFLWREIGPALAVEQHTAYAVDLFGHGESDRPFDADFGIAAQSEYLERAMTALRIPRAVLVGVDLGGTVAMHLAASRPEAVTRLILINPLAFDAIPARDVRTLQRSTARFAFRLSRGVLGVTPLLTPLLTGSVTNPERMPPNLIARYLAPFVGKEGVGHLLTLARAIRPEDMGDVDLGEITAPALVVWGDEDRWVDPGIANRLVNAIPDSRLLRVPGVGRLIPEENPGYVSDLVGDFVSARGGV